MCADGGSDGDAFRYTGKKSSEGGSGQVSDRFKFQATVYGVVGDAIKVCLGSQVIGGADTKWERELTCYLLCGEMEMP